MANGGLVLVNTSLMAVGSNVTTPVVYNGGQSVLIISAQQLPTVANLVLTGVGSQGLNITINSGVLAGPGVFNFNAPAGSYCVHTSGGSSIGLYMALMPV